MASAPAASALAAGPHLPSRQHCCCAPARAALARRLRPRRRLAVAVAAAGAPRSEADLYQGINPVQQEAPQPASGLPLYVVAPLAFFGLIAALRTAKAVKKKMGQGNRLEERGFKKGGGIADDRAYTRALKNIRTTKFEELSDEQIEAARRRRRREVEKDYLPVDLDQIELPENHPFAVRRNLAPDEEALQRSRFSARRGLSPEDMQRLREQQALADQMDAEEEARQARRG